MKFFDHYTTWQDVVNLPARSYRCGYCSDKVSSEKGVQSYNRATGKREAYIFLCPNCNGPTFITPRGDQLPSPIFGNSVSKVPEELNALYEEARKCTAHNCFTSSVLTCRKILMNIAVSQGANEGLRFIEYVNYLSDKGFIPPNGRHWVDHIRKKGNEATHEIQVMEADDARELLVFVEMLLKFIYEFPSMVAYDA